METFEFTIEHINTIGYYIVSPHYDLYDDIGIASFFNMSLDEYSNHLIMMFEGRINGTLKIVVFEKMENAIKAYEWINSLLMMKKLRGELNA